MTHDFSLVFDTDNEYWQRVLDIFDKNEKYEKKVVSNRNLHHKFPRSFSKILGEPVDNDKDNLISLSLADHFLVHYYYYLLARKGYRQSMATAFTFMAKKGLKYMTPETAEAMAKDYAEAKTISNKHISEMMRGRKLPEEHKKHIKEHAAHLFGEANGMHGKHHSEDSRKKQSESMREYYNTHPEYREAISPIGRHHTDETKAKQSAAHKGKPSKLKGSKFTEERRQKQVEAIKAWWERRRTESSPP